MNENYMAVLEALLFTANEPLAEDELADTISITPAEVRKYLSLLIQRYQNNEHGIVLKKYNNKYQLTSKKKFSSYIEKLHKLSPEVNLSNAALETLAIIAYEQPVTRAKIEEIRGVKAEKTLITLTKYNLIKELGRKDTIGNPIVYGTTDIFLQHFDLENLSQLPNIEEMS